MKSTIGTTIRAVRALTIFDSRGYPTVEATVELACGSVGRAAAPSGASTGSKEARELRDGGKRLSGKGVSKACRNIAGALARAVVGLDSEDQEGLDQAMIECDGTATKANLGANAILVVSLACAKAAAAARQLPLYRYLGGTAAVTLPVPMMNIINGGAHAANNIAIQEFMIVPTGARNFAEAMTWGTEIYHALRELLAAKGLATAVGDEGGFAPDIDGDEKALELIMSACRKAGREPGKDVWLALDCAANELRQPGGGYTLGADRGAKLKSEDMVSLLANWRRKYPIASIEDGLAETDWSGWQKLCARLGASTQLVGDDLFVTNVTLLRKGMASKAANAILIKPNQCGSLSETRDAVFTAKDGGFRTVVSHRSGETEDATIADLAVAWNCGQIKTGAPARGERTAKYNQLLRIEAELGRAARYRGTTLLCSS